MGYFNYFIKCVIRKFVNLLFKPKLLVIFLIFISLLFVFQITSRAEWTDEEKTSLTNQLEDIRVALIEQLNDLEDINKNTSSISEDVVVLRRTLTSIDSAIYDVIQRLITTNSSLNDIKSQLSTLLIDIDNLNTSINNVYTKLDENQKELLTELEADNQAVLEELNMIRDAINGSEEELTSYTDLGIINDSLNSTHGSLKGIMINYEPKYSYKIKIHLNNTWDSTQLLRVGLFESPVSNGYVFNDYKSYMLVLGEIPANSTDFIISYDVPSSNPKYIYFNFSSFITEIEVYRSIKGIVESLNDTNSLQQQQNQLQQQQNQLQQEQNDFIHQETQDSSVDINGFNNVDSNDVTSNGLSGVFTNIYNSISSWSSKDIKLPIPYTNKNIVIPSNYTNNMLSSFGGGWIITFISAIYYFIVSRFIIYSITGIINSIKSGSILETDSKYNITTDML